MSLVKPYLITLRLRSGGGGGQDLEIRLCSGGGEAGLSIFTGFREFRPTAGLQVIVTIK